MNKDEKSRYESLVRLGCCVCQRTLGVHTPPQIHHLRGHPWSGMGQRASWEHTIPLCMRHHVGDGWGISYHAGPEEFQRRFGSQEELLEWTNSVLAR
jgi:hypothetical protein